MATIIIVVNMKLFYISGNFQKNDKTQKTDEVAKTIKLP